MSDTKWRKLFAVLLDMNLEQIVMQFIDYEKPRLIKVSGLGMYTPRPFLDTLEFGPIELRAIEWVEIPRIAKIPRLNNSPPAEISQDIDRVAEALSSVARFPVEHFPNELRIVGYSR
jgi:hypothetical protein